MHGVRQNGKSRNFDKAHPGCLGKMVNLFELNMGVSANRLLTDKPHRDGSPLSRSRSDVSRMSPSNGSTEEKVVVSEYNNSFSNRKSHVTPMKMLIAQEMSKDVNSRNDPPNLVAKLMGLDTLPQKESDAATQRSYSRVHPRSHSEIPTCYWQKQNGFFHPIDPNECQDFYGVWHQQQKFPNKETYEETTNDKQMALVRQKFVEAKRLSMDANLRQSKQFQDALEVLSSNKDLFLKCLQEPNSVFYQHLHSQQSVPPQAPPQETKRITVLKPSKVPDSSKVTGSGNKDGIQIKKAAFLQVNGMDKILSGTSPSENFKYDECSTQPTRIVVLKPSPGRLHNLKGVSPRSETQRTLHADEFLGGVEDDENKRSREVAKAITQQMREKLGRHRRDETLISSVYSNASVGDESSFHISEIDYADGNLSDSEGMSPVSRHSWDCGNRLGSPYSSSPFSRASYSPESSVCREAKRRLSERWAMMSSNGRRQEPKHVRRNSSTLGEMLALSEANTLSPVGEGCSAGESKDFDSELRHDDNVDISPRSLMRSKSVPVSCTEFGMTPNIVSVPDKARPVAPCEHAKAKCVKSSFKGKVSNLFFSRNRKPDEDKPLQTEANNQHRSLPGEMPNDRIETLSDKVPRHPSSGLKESSVKSSYSGLIDKQHLAPTETSLAVAKPFAPGKQGENQDQPSPISVLDQPFVEDEAAANVFPHFAKSIQYGAEPPHDSIGSNLIDKSPPIGSIARTLSWDDSCVDTASSYLADETLIIQGTGEDKEEWYSFIKTLLSVAGFHDDLQSNSFFARWHSPESPLDPLLRDNYIEDKEALHEAKRRQKRSTQKLVFDCVNAALMEIIGYRSFSGHQIIPCTGANNCILERGLSTLVDEVWARMPVLSSDEVRCLSDDCGDDNSLVVERVVRKEVAGKGWIDHLRLEMDSLGNEIEEKLLAELVHHAVVDLTGRA